MVVRPVRSPVRAWRSYLGIVFTLARRQTVPDRSRLDHPTTPSSSASTTGQTRKMRRLAHEQLGGVVESAVAARHPRSAHQSHEPSKQATQLTTATASGEPILGGISERERSGVSARIDTVVVTEWLKRQCAPYGHGPTITNPHTLRRIATLALTGLADEATSTPSASSRWRQGRTRVRAAGGS
jgi:hypothetical protein